MNYLRDYWHHRGVQCEVRKIVKNFRKTWGEGKGNSSYLLRIFPRGVPQKRGNRLAGLMRTRGEP